MSDPRLPSLLEEAAKLREDLLSTAELLTRFGVVAPQRVAAIRSGTGYVDMANDVEQLGVLFDEVWKDVAKRVPVTRAMVDRAPVLAHELHVALGIKRVGSGAPTDDAQKTRQRAFTLFARAYEECRRGAGYLRHHLGDLDQVVPSIYVKQRRRGAAAGEEIESGAVEPGEGGVVTETAPAPAVGDSPTAPAGA